MNEMKALIKEAWQNHRGKLVGTVLGVVLGASIMLFGFFKTAFILLCGLIGLFVGKKVDEQEDFRDLMDKIIPPGFRR